MSEKNESVEQKAEAQQEAPKVIYIYKKHKNKKKKKTNPKPCHNGGYRMADLEKAMTSIELAQYTRKKEELDKSLVELDKLKNQSKNLSEYTYQVFNRLSLGNIDGYVNLLTKQVKPLLENIRRWKNCIKDIRADIKGILEPAIKRLDNINSKEPFKPQEVLKKFEKSVETKEGTPKKACYNLSREDALMLVKEITDMLKANPNGRRIDVFIAAI
jgi:hypothetical protein